MAPAAGLLLHTGLGRGAANGRALSWAAAHVLLLEGRRCCAAARMGSNRAQGVCCHCKRRRQRPPAAQIHTGPVTSD